MKIVNPGKLILAPVWEIIFHLELSSTSVDIYIIPGYFN